MSGGVSGPRSGTSGWDPQADPARVDALVHDMQNVSGIGPSWLAFIDNESTLKTLADKLLAGATIDGPGAVQLVQEAKDFGKVTDSEKQVFVNLLRDHFAQFTPDARTALSQFFGIPLTRPSGEVPIITPGIPSGPATAPTPTPTPAPVGPAAPTTPMSVVAGPQEYSLDDDTLYLSGDGKFSSSINRDIYTAGYLPRTDGPLNNPLGTPAPASGVLSPGDVALNAKKSPVERFDEAMKRATGGAGGLTARYAKEGKQPEAKSWWGYCDRWSYSALDPQIAPFVNKPIQYKGVYFSTAELRGLASFLGRSDEGAGLFKQGVSPIDLAKATSLFLKTNGPGFISDIWLDKAHPGDSEVWNQPFDAVDQNVKELKGNDLAKVLKDQFKLSGPAAAGKRAFLVETTGHYGVEAGEENEGPATHDERHWKSWIVADSSGKAIDGKFTPDSDEAPEYIWRPNRTGQFAPEAKFFRDLIKAGVPEEKVKAFEGAIAALPPRPVSSQQKADLVAKYRGIATAYPDPDLARKLAPIGLSPADFR